MAARGRQDHYEVLGVSPDAPDEVIRAAYRALAAKYHPDRNPADSGAELQLKRLNAAFAVLGDSAKRRQYDELTRSPDGGEDPSPKSDPKEESDQARWRVRHDDVPPRSETSTPRDPRVHNPRTTSRLLAACLAAGVSLYVNLSGPSGADENAAALVGLLIGCGLLAWFVYWLAGKVAPGVVSGVVVIVGVGALALTSASRPNVSKVTTTATPDATATASAAAVQLFWITQPGYRIAFPDNPGPAARSTEATRAGPASVTTFELNRSSGAAYEIEQMDYPPGSVVNEQGAVDGALKGLGSQAHDTPKLVSDGRAMIGNCNGRSFLATVKGFAVRCLFCVSGSHAYMATAAVPAAASSDIDWEANSFLGSFSITATTLPAQKAQPSKPSVDAEALCAHNVLCARCRLLYGAGEDCLRYLNDSAEATP